MIQQFKAARRVSTPIVVIRTPDAGAAQQLITRMYTEEMLVRWDSFFGLSGLTTTAKQELLRLGVGSAEVSDVQLLDVCFKLHEDAIVLAHNLHKFWTSPATMQGVWNLRDHFKATGSMLVVLCPIGTEIPPGLSDVLVLDEDYPNQEQMEKIVERVDSDFLASGPGKGCSSLSREEVLKAVDAVIGLAAFPAEQAAAMCRTTAGMDMNQLWENKRKKIEQRRGMMVWRGGENFSGIGGCSNVKKFAKLLLQKEYRLILFFDEINHMMQGSTTDLSGVKGDFLQQLLAWIQDKEVDMVLFVGPPGSGKSNVAKAMGNEAGVPTVQFDLNGMQSGIIGSSGENLRAALREVEAMGQGRILIVATCNEVDSLPIALRRRAKKGTFYFDLPTKEAREKIWHIYVGRCGINFGGSYKPGKPISSTWLPEDDGWTGAEIRECCEKAVDFGISLKDSAAYVVPVARSMADEIKRLRMQASGKFIDAESPGLYEYHEQAVSERRKIRE
jgi:hypothetical protein